ncbi:MAG: SRPBCC family protein [Sphingobacterium composti]|uniref:SRPBCC domain-containing protein n=1 Tax=Sphingobacterium composti TaxID=363260 RepID=UPI00135A7160|nr:SRPBCC domain-containing protein [Sphingobacterium composti Ten et al. 2007 non Yoo et al. 2007]
MKKEISTSITIQASAQKIWTILLNFEKYPDWNPFIRKIVGEPIVGNQLNINITPPNGSNMNFKPQVLSHIPEKEFIWKGKLLFKGLFDGTHIFRLQENPDGSTTFIHKEEFSGILVGMINLSNTEQGFKLMNQQLKSLAEQ